jgi:hypothetical protein
MEETIRWLLTGPAWIRYNVLLNLMEMEKENPQILSAYNEMRKDPLIIGLLAEIVDWEKTILKRHNDASHPIHKLSFLADIGISHQEEAVQSVIKSIKDHQSLEGPFQVLSNYPTHFGGSGENEWTWCLCDAPTLLYILVKFGKTNDQTLVSAFNYLESLIKENGWPCAASKSLGNFRGPGKKDDPCPYANLIMLKTVSILNESGFSRSSQLGVETMLDLWENSREKRPYLFRMGTDFRKLKVPFIWYDILHVLNVLSAFKDIHNDPRFLSMLDIVKQKAGQEFRFKSESIWTKWKGWEFCQKKEPSMWVTYNVLLILKRISNLKFQSFIE